MAPYQTIPMPTLVYLSLFLSVDRHKRAALHVPTIRIMGLCQKWGRNSNEDARRQHLHLAENHGQKHQNFCESFLISNFKKFYAIPIVYHHQIVLDQNSAKNQNLSLRSSKFQIKLCDQLRAEGERENFIPFFPHSFYKISI